MASLPRILVVDDNDDARDLLAALLVGQGYPVATAADAALALEVAASFLPEIAVLDIGLPGMDGWELAAMLRNLDGLAELRMVALTGYGSARDHQRSREAGMYAHLVKPVEVATLTRTFTRGVA